MIVKTQRILLSTLILAAASHTLAELPTLQWKPETQRLLVPGGTYGRIKALPEGAWLCSYEKNAKSWAMRSEDEGRTWSQGVLAGSVEGGTAANPELCVLASGKVICFFNERPKKEGDAQKFSIRSSHSDDGGRSWTQSPQPIFEGGNMMAQGCWEPAAIEMPGGEIRLFFAHELPGQQEIALMTSRDGGASWSGPKQVSLRPQRRDGMPVPCLLKNGRLVFSIEDNGIAGQDRPHPPFRPSIVDYEKPDRWMALKSPPSDRNNVAAPYLTRLPTGETLLAVQTNAEEPRWHRMAVFIGDAEAKGFMQRTLPFGLPPESNAEWNSLFVKDERTVLALTHATIQGKRGLWCIEGQVKRSSDPFVGSVPSGGVVPKMNVEEQQKHPWPDRDKFGGLKAVQTKATGFFRVEQLKSRWFFITPQGHPYIAIGPNHTGPTIRDQGRHIGLWQRWNHSPDETAKNMLPIIQGMGFTAGDVYQPESTYTRTLPWVSFFWYGDTNHSFIDVFNAAMMADVTRRAHEHARSLADNPWVLGIGGPDLSIWDDKLVRKYRELKPEAPGRQKYVQFLRELYRNDISAFNTTYTTAFTSFDELSKQEKIRYPCDDADDQLDPSTLRWRLPVPADKSQNPAMTRDNDTFCALIASTLFPQVRAAVKRGAPNHLFLGEHLAVRMIPAAVIAAMAPHIDAYLAQAVEVSPQRPPEWQLFQRDRWDAEHALLQKPIIIVDWGAVFSLGESFEYQGATIKPEREASDEAAKFVLDAFERPYIIGLFLCKLWGEHKNDTNFFQNRATRTYLKPDATDYPYRTDALRKANFEAQRRVFERVK